MLIHCIYEKWSTISIIQFDLIWCDLLKQKQIMEAELPGIDSAFFQKATHLHLTFGVCVLLDSVERAKAMEVLQSCK